MVLLRKVGGGESDLEIYIEEGEREGKRERRKEGKERKEKKRKEKEHTLPV